MQLIAFNREPASSLATAKLLPLPAASKAARSLYISYSWVGIGTRDQHLSGDCPGLFTCAEHLHSGLS